MAKLRYGKWVPCPDGELADLGDRLRARQSRRRLLQATATVAASLLTGGLLFAWLRPSPRGGFSPTGEVEYAGITCTRVKEQANDYARKTLSETARDQIRQHLAQCSSCRDHYKARGLM